MVKPEEEENPFPERAAAWEAYNAAIAILRAEYASRQTALRVELDQKIARAHAEYDSAIRELRAWFDSEVEKNRRSFAKSI